MKIVVIGAGAIGLSCAYYLAKAGAEVTVLDAAEPGAGASRRNAGWVVPSMSEPVPSPAALRQAVRWAWRRDSPLRVKPSLDRSWITFMSRMVMSCRRRTYEAGLLAIAELNRTTRQAFDEIEADGVRFEHHRAGTLFAFTTSDTIEAHLADLDAMTAFGTPPARFLSGDDARSLEPALSQAVVGAILSPGERHVDPSSFVDGMVRACTELGVKIIGGARVVNLHTRGNRASAALGGSAWPADAFVLAAGVWSPGVLRSAGIKLPVQPGKGYGLDFTPSPVQLHRSIYLADHKVAVTPLDRGVRICGTMEFTGIDYSIDAVRAAAIARAADLYLDGWPKARTPAPWASLRPMTPDGLPIIGTLPGLHNVAIATGHAMLGITLAPVTGQSIARVLLDKADLPVLRPFAPSRFRALAHGIGLAPGIHTCPRETHERANPMAEPSHDRRIRPADRRGASKRGPARHTCRRRLASRRRAEASRIPRVRNDRGCQHHWRDQVGRAGRI